MFFKILRPKGFEGTQSGTLCEFLLYNVKMSFGKKTDRVCTINHACIFVELYFYHGGARYKGMHRCAGVVMFVCVYMYECMECKYFSITTANTLLGTKLSQQ